MKKSRERNFSFFVPSLISVETKKIAFTVNRSDREY